MFFMAIVNGKKIVGVWSGSVRTGYLHIMSSVNRDVGGVGELPGGREAENTAF